jgi:hypothetical protein
MMAGRANFEASWRVVWEGILWCGLSDKTQDTPDARPLIGSITSRYTSLAVQHNSHTVARLSCLQPGLWSCLHSERAGETHYVGSVAGFIPPCAELADVANTSRPAGTAAHISFRVWSHAAMHWANNFRPKTHALMHSLLLTRVKTRV